MEETKETANTQEKGTTDTTGSSNPQTNQVPGYTLESGVKMKPCKYCRVMVPKKAKICPNCKKKIKKNWLGLLVFLLIIALLAGGGAYYYLYLYQPAPAMSPAATTGTETATTDEATKETVTDTATEDTTADMGTADMGTADTTVDAAAEETKADATAANTDTGVESTEGKDASKDTATDTSDATEENAEVNLLNQPLTEETATENGTDTNQSTAKDTDKDDSTDTKADALENPLTVGDEEAEEEAAPEVIDPTAYSEEEFRAMCTNVDFKKLMRTPDTYLNQCLTLEVTIVAQVDGGLFDENTYYLVSAEDKNGVERYYILRDDRGEEAVLLFEGDVITVYGQMFATCKVPVEYGIRNNKVPAISIVYCDLEEE